MDDNEQDYHIPTKLDAPPLFFLWEADSAVLVIAWVIIGALMNMPILGVVFAVVMGRGYAYLKEEGGRGLITKLLYWYTPSDVWLSKHASSNVREYIGG